jgi:hypothetical protein
MLYIFSLDLRDKKSLLKEKETYDKLSVQSWTWLS